MEPEVAQAKKTGSAEQKLDPKSSSGAKWKIILFTLLVVGGIGAMLYNNKQKSKKIVVNDVLKEIPVTVATVNMERLDDKLSLVGTIVANSDVMVASETQGRIKSVNIKVGDMVSAGSVLYIVDSELREAGVLSAEANFDKAKTDYDRYQALFAENAVTKAQVDAARQTYKSAEAQLITARRQLRDTKITSPISGTVANRMFDVGANVNPGTAVANIVDISRLKVRISVAEKDAFKLRSGEKVEVTTDVYPGVSFPATIQSIAAKSDEAHTYPVEILLPNSKSHPLRAGMFARVSFGSVQPEPKVSVPREALIGSVKEPQVYVVESNVAKLRNITVGAESHGKLEVLQGLNAGEIVVVNGQNNLSDNAKISIMK